MNNICHSWICLLSVFNRHSMEFQSIAYEAATAAQCLCWHFAAWENFTHLLLSASASATTQHSNQTVFWAYSRLQRLCSLYFLFWLTDVFQSSWWSLASPEIKKNYVGRLPRQFRLSVRQSVTRVLCVKTAERIIEHCRFWLPWVTQNPRFKVTVCSKANISQTVHPIHSMFGSRQGFSGSADRMALFAVR